MQSTLNSGGDAPLPSGSEEIWTQLAPLLDDAMNQLGETDRAALVLRYFENKTAREIAAALRMKEEAAQKRVGRALEKLRQLFAKRGVDSTADAITRSIAANSVQIAPVALAKTVSAVALAKGAAASTSTLTLVKGALKIMAWTKAKTAVVTSAFVLLAAGTTTITVNHYSHHSTRKLPMTPANMALFSSESSKLMNDAKMSALLCIVFTGVNQHQLPTNFSELNAADIGTNTAQYLNARNYQQLSDTNWVFAASGDPTAYSNPGKTICFMEKAPRQSPDGTFARVYATIDGRVFLLTSSTEDFTAAEKKQGFLVQRTVK